MKRIRQIHFYLGVFFAPLIVIFALSGALQTFRLQEAPKGSSYTPPAWIVKLADIHKDQRAAHVQGQPRSLPLQWFVVVMSVGLICTSLLGIYMGFKFNYDKRLLLGLIALGFVIPLALLYL
ncbi:MAG: PepSY domain-containing protein [Acidobacteria bacterium]|nr:PepSY domain-containing protein [Acidobacteriota bacterium]